MRWWHYVVCFSREDKWEKSCERFFSASARSESSLDDFLQRNPPRRLDQLVQLQVLPGQLSECVENKSKTWWAYRQIEDDLNSLTA